ncbi:MAG: N-6 DNA methylase [Candidatus Verstraetearchaeota archaeon]|nr:N-6 DNA methylase [Candidatus Verstraetearchaeota archaeon]
MDTSTKIRASFKKLYGKIKSAKEKELSHEDLRVAFVDSGILKLLGYEGVPKDVRFEKGVGGKRSDLLTFDDYKNVVFVVEFKKPAEIDAERDFEQLWEQYVKPLRARYGVLTDGLEFLVYERINSNWERKPHVNLGEVTIAQCEEIYNWLKKPGIKRTNINEVLRYFERFDNPEERINLSSEIAQQHFFDSFELKEGSIFEDLVQKTIGLFDFELERSKFLKSAYNFWKVSYAKKPERVPENWRRIMDKIGLEMNNENLFKFMFCLESAYSLFTRLILAKACEDYKLPDIDFSGFIKNQIRNISFRGDISLLAWAITTRDLIKSMKQKLVKSVFEGDIFYWWEDSYKELSAGDYLYSPYHRYEKQKAYFSEALADIILALYKFDFSEIVGDPLGTLYQRYFDKETRKALGEFYTPIEVVKYILDAVGYEGQGIIHKRLLDPACGSGTFLVEALRRYLKASERIADEEGWSRILKRLCNEYCIAGFDIHPFATFMAQMQFMLVLIPAYKKAMEEDPHFVLNRLPIFRTDSLVDETKGESRKVTIEESVRGIRHILIDTGLPVDGGNLKIKMPYNKDVFGRAGLLNAQEYFAALQAVFDTVKESAREEKYEVDKEELERNFKRYLEDKEWNRLVSFFTPYAEHFLEKFKELKATFGDGKLIKSVEDIMLAAILKNYVKYDFVVGNPPYVNIRMIAKDQKKYYGEIYDTAKGLYDLYCVFIEKGLKVLLNHGKLGYICSNQFLLTDYGKYLREFLTKYNQENENENYKINQILDFRDSGVFLDVVNYPCIIVFNKIGDLRDAKSNIIRCVRVAEPSDKIFENIKMHLANTEYLGKSFDIFDYLQSDLNGGTWKLMPKVEKEVFSHIERIADTKFGEITKDIFVGTQTSKDDVYLVFVTQDLGDGLVKIKPQRRNEEFIIEKKILKPLLKGKDITKWCLNWSGHWLIFPYKDEDKTKLMSEDELKKGYPHAWDYLLRHKRIIESREGGRWRGVPNWYEFGRPNNHELFEQTKMVTQLLSTKNKFALDEEGIYYFIAVGGDCVTLKDKYNEKDEYLYVLGLLNSSVLEYYIKHISPVHEGGFYLYIKQYLEELPIRYPTDKKGKEIKNQITEKVRTILERIKLQQKIENFPDEYIKEYRSKGEEFDSINISFNSNHKAIEPVVEKDIDGRGYNIVIGKKEKPVFVESKVKADYVSAALKGKRAKKDEKKQILIPKSDAIVEEILKKLEEDKARIKSPSVGELEGEINELVYKLYGLNEEDVKVIEDFLRRF